MHNVLRPLSTGTAKKNAQYGNTQLYNYTISILMKLSPTVRYTEEYLHKYSSKTRDKKKTIFGNLEIKKQMFSKLFLNNQMKQTESGT